MAVEVFSSDDLLALILYDVHSDAPRLSSVNKAFQRHLRPHAFGLHIFVR